MSACVGVPQFLRALAHGLLERSARVRLRFRPRAARGVLAQRLDRDPAEEDRAEPDEHAEPAQIIGQPVGLGGEDSGLRFIRSRSAARSLSAISSSLSRSCGPVGDSAACVEIAGAALPRLRDRGARGEREFLAALA